MMVSQTRVETGHKKHLDSGCIFNLEPRIHGLGVYIKWKEMLLIDWLIAVRWDIELEMSFRQPDREVDWAVCVWDWS